MSETSVDHAPRFVITADESGLLDWPLLLLCRHSIIETVIEGVKLRTGTAKAKVQLNE